MKQNKTQDTPPQKQVSVFAVLKPYRGMVFLLVLLALLGSGINLIIPRIVSSAIDSFSAGNYEVRRVVGAFLGVSLSIFVLIYLQGILQAYLSEKVARDLRKQISDKISRQSYAYIQKTNPSKILTNITSDVDSIKLFVAQAIVTLISSLAMIIGTSILLIHLNWRLALPVLLIIPIIMGAFFIVISRVRKLFVQAREVVDWLNRIINESILGAALIRVIHSQHAEYNKFLDANERSKNLGTSILRLFAILVPIISFSASLAVLAILVLGGKLVITGSMSMGEFAAFFNYLSMLIFPILMIGFMSGIIAQATAAYQRISEVLLADEPQLPGTVSEKLRGQILVENVTVNYADRPALKNVSLDLKPGSKTAIIGPTAAGKTQLLFLLTGLIEANHGRVLIDDRQLTEYLPDCLNSQIGIVFQDSVIFNTSLRENIAFNDAVSEADMMRAIDTAELREFIDSLPNGLETVVSERGTSLSGGQKQRIMLARALALNPRILLLDDFTARVDAATELRILSNVQRFYPELTLLSVTQKISSIENYDSIVLLMEGEIVAQGTHNELLSTCPEYVQIYDSQRSTNHIVK